jgi:molybdopterin-binding protein
MKLSENNSVKGRVIEIIPGLINIKVKLDIGGGNEIVSVINIDSLNGMNINIGDEALLYLNQ